MTSESDRLLRLAVDVARRAGDLLSSGLDDDRRVESKSTATDLVTDMDRAAERLVVDSLLDQRPDDGIVGEEGTDITGTSGIQWIVDPLDGTTNYVYRHPGFSVSIAAHRDGEPLLGVVADPVQGHVFTALVGAGAHRNGTPIHCSPLDDLATALMATGFSYDPEVRRWQARILTHVLPSIRDIRRMGGAAVDLASAASGRVDAYFERGLQVWDMAAGAVIATEAGAVVTDLDGGPPSQQWCVAAPPGLHGPLLDILARADAAVGEESGGTSHSSAPG
ncbi:MAG: inositol monophosphatase family protein [Acidimicrobiales bacterium]